MRFHEQLERTTLARQVEIRIDDMILANGMQPGSSLPSIATLAEDLGVSRPVVREALRSLEARGVIRIQNGKNATVNLVTSAPLQDYFGRAVRQRSEALLELVEVRRGLEVQGALLAAKRRDQDDLERMDAILASMRKALGDAATFAELDTQLHLSIVAASKNAMLFRLSESIRDLTKDTIREGLKIPFPGRPFGHLVEGHERIVEAIRSGSPAVSARTMAEHLDGAGARMVKHLQDRNP